MTRDHRAQRHRRQEEVERRLRQQTAAERHARARQNPHPAEVLPRLLQIAQAVSQQLNDPAAQP